MVSPKPEFDLTPLEQIRQCEAEMTRRVLAAHEAAEKTIAKAALDAATIRKQAREAGSQEGQARYREIVSKAMEEAELLVAQAKHREEELRRQGNHWMEAAILGAVNFILGREKEG